MMVNEAVYAMLQGNGNVLALAGTRTYPVTSVPMDIAAGDDPYIAWEALPEQTNNHMGGTSQTVIGAVRIKCYGLTMAAAESLEAAAVSALNRKQGLYGGTVVKLCLRGDVTREPEPITDGRDRPLYCVVAPYSMILTNPTL